MKQIMITISITLALLSGGQMAIAQGSVAHSAQAANGSVQASGHAVIAAAQLTSAAIAIPFMAGGAIGAVSNNAGQAMLKAADADFHKPLRISDESVTAGPAPDRALYGEQE